MIELDISYQQWMQDTSIGHLHRRGSLLQRLDQAIQDYCMTSAPGTGDAGKAFAVRQAFDDWKSDKIRQGGHWPSERDRNGAVSALEAQLDSGGVNGASFRALQYADPVNGARLQAADESFEAMNRNRLRTVFEGASIVFVGSEAVAGTAPTSRADYVIHPLKQAQDRVQHAVSSVGSVAWEGIKKRLHIPDLSDERSHQLEVAEEWGKAFYTLADAAFGDKIMDKIKGTPIGQRVEAIISTATAAIPPWLGTVWSARNVAQEWAEVAVSTYKCLDIGNRGHTMADGSPIAAFNAMRSALKAEIGNAAAEASLSSAALITKTLSTHLDFGALSGPLIGLAEAIAKAAHQIVLLVAQYRAARQLAQVLKKPSGLDVTVFQTYPLLGAYYIHCADLSSLVPITNRFTPDWMSRVEAMKRESRYVYEAAQKLIDSCPFKIINVQKIARSAAAEHHGMAKLIYADMEGVITGVEGVITTVASAA